MYLYFKTGLGDSRKGFKIKYSQGKAGIHFKLPYTDSLFSIYLIV